MPIEHNERRRYYFAFVFDLIDRLADGKITFEQFEDDLTPECLDLNHPDDVELLHVLYSIQYAVTDHYQHLGHYHSSAGWMVRLTQQWRHLSEPIAEAA